MPRRFIRIALIAFPLILAASAAAADDAQDAKSRPTREEILDQMAKVRSTPSAPGRIAGVLAGLDHTATPRSDFLFCTGLAHLGDARAQACVAKAYERGIGVVEDWMEAHAWYELACETGIPDADEARKTAEARDQLTMRLMSAYPHPTEEELADQVGALKSTIARYRAEIEAPK